MKMSVGVLDHYNVSTRKLNETVQFSIDAVGNRTYRCRVVFGAPMSLS
jgi:hypothetical protein